MIKKLKVTVDGKSYEVSVEVPDQPEQLASPSPEAIISPAPVKIKPTTSGSGEIVSPLAGRVISIGVEPGKDVNEGDHVLTLEAMKMNTFVFAPKTGKIKEVRTAVGAAVQEGDVLLLMT